MNVVRIRTRLKLPIPQLPELAPLIGKDIEIVAREQAAVESDRKPARFTDLKGGWPEDQVNDGFEEDVDPWRKEPWRAADAANGDSRGDD